jgi:hypothetical protein
MMLISLIEASEALTGDVVVVCYHERRMTALQHDDEHMQPCVTWRRSPRKLADFSLQHVTLCSCNLVAGGQRNDHAPDYQLQVMGVAAAVARRLHKTTELRM